MNSARFGGGGSPELILWDLSEVLIGGILGLEDRLIAGGTPPPDIGNLQLGGDHLTGLFLGEINEESYLSRCLERTEGHLSHHDLHEAIHESFRTGIDGSLAVLLEVNRHFPCGLVSDHAREWVETIRQVHGFLSVFDRLFWSFDTKMTKMSSDLFVYVLAEMGVASDRCLFIDDREDNVEVARTTRELLAPSR